MSALSFQPSDDIGLDETDWSLLRLAQAARDVSDDVTNDVTNDVTEESAVALRALALAGGSPHGARPKALVMYDSASSVVSTLHKSPGEPWLVKFQAANEHAEVCAIEHAYAEMARACGVNMGPTEHFALVPNLAAFGTRRFDRDRGMRVPVHSMAGALHVDFRTPALDYETLLRATGFFTRDQHEVFSAYRLCVFNVVFNNRDDHAKNFSLRMNEHMRWEFAPGYDLTYNAGPGGYHQTSVMGEALQPARSHLLSLAGGLALPATESAAVIDQACAVAEELPAALDRAGVRRATRTTVIDAVERNVLRCGLSAAPASRRRSRN